MAILTTGASGATFSLDGQDYTKGLYETFYGNVSTLPNGNADERSLEVGLKNINTAEVIQDAIMIRAWKNGAGTPYLTLDSLVADLTSVAGLGTPDDPTTGLRVLQENYAGTSWGIFSENIQTLEEDRYTIGAKIVAKYTGATDQTLVYGADTQALAYGSANVAFLYGLLSRIYIFDTATTTNGIASSSLVYNRSTADQSVLQAHAASIKNEAVSGTTGTARCFKADVSNKNAGATISLAEGLAIRDWSNKGTITESRGIYIDTTVDLGATSYAILSDSTSLSKFAGNIEAKVVKTQGFTVSTLPASPEIGMRTYVTDALAPAFRVRVDAGGSDFTPVIYDGINWICA